MPAKTVAVASIIFTLAIVHFFGELHVIYAVLALLYLVELRTQVLEIIGQKLTGRQLLARYGTALIMAAVGTVLFIVTGIWIALAREMYILTRRRVRSNQRRREARAAAKVAA